MKDHSYAAPMAFRLLKSTVKRLDEIAERMSQPAMKVTRTDALRIALERGINEIESDAKRGKK